MSLPRVLVTGPVESLDEWCAAARGAGWEPVAWPLVEIRELAPAPDEARALLAGARPGLVCVSSVHALPFLCALAEREPGLRALPCAVVGQRSVSRLRSSGFHGAIEWFPSAEALREQLLAAQPRARTVLWPRGDKSDELARALRAAGLEVLDPLAYTNRPRAQGEAPPACELVFFASPSAVQAWMELAAAPSPGRALTIGATTLQALLREKRQPFFDTLSLPEPTSSCFAAALQHIDPRPTP